MEENNKFQGVAHLIGIFVIPILIVGGYYSSSLFIRIIIGIALLGVFYFLWKKGIKILYQNKHPYAGGENYYAVFFEDPDKIKVEIVATKVRNGNEKFPPNN